MQNNKNRVPDSGTYCFTLDDNIRFLEQSTKEHLASLFEHPYLAFLQKCSRTYQARFQLNMYYSYAPGGFSLADVPDCWRQELEENAGWLRFSFHALHNDPPFPYQHADAQKLTADFRKVMEQLRRIAGKAATSQTTTIHYMCAAKEACTALHREGVQALIGMFYRSPESPLLPYYFSESQIDAMQFPIWRDEETGLFFASNDCVLNRLALPEITPYLNRLALPEITPYPDRQRRQFYQVMIHEQYFYPDYADYQPDFRQKVEAALEWFRERHMESCFLEDYIRRAPPP